VQPRRFFIRVIFASGLGLVGLGLMGGCDDGSRTTGTQLQISPEVKAQMDEIKSAQKDIRAERKQERAEARKKRR
jgi:hypothetical protein